MLIEKKIYFNGNYLTLTNKRALYWEAERSLILSDLHLGKAAHFRKNGVSIPTQVAENDIGRLQELLIHYLPEKVVIVGDLIHAGANKEITLFSDMRYKFPKSEFILVKGNHDRQYLSFFQSIGIDDIYDSLQVKNILLIHEVLNRDCISISGHFHPGVTIRLPTEKRKKFPCFAVNEKQLVLPAFSVFSGLFTQWDNNVRYKFFALYAEGIIELV